MPPDPPATLVAIALRRLVPWRPVPSLAVAAPNCAKYLAETGAMSRPVVPRVYDDDEEDCDDMLLQ